MTADGSQGLSSFADLRVVGLGVWVAAPASAALLADWGAEVVKVEPPGGDPMRNVFGSLGMGDDLPKPAFALAVPALGEHTDEVLAELAAGRDPDQGPDRR